MANWWWCMPNPAFWPDGTPRSQNNAFTGHGYEVSDVVDDMRRASIAERVGAASAATKRAQGKEMQYALSLPGSTPRKEKA